MEREITEEEYKKLLNEKFDILLKISAYEQQQNNKHDEMCIGLVGKCICDTEGNYHKVVDVRGRGLVCWTIYSDDQIEKDDFIHFDFYTISGYQEILEEKFNERLDKLVGKIKA